MAPAQLERRIGRGGARSQGVEGVLLGARLHVQPEVHGRQRGVHDRQRRGVRDATSKSTEGLLALSCGSRAEVDDLVKNAIAAGGQHAMESQDHGFMYGWSFYDIDGHHWEVFWMDPSAT